MSTADLYCSGSLTSPRPNTVASLPYRATLITPPHRFLAMGNAQSSTLTESRTESRNHSAGVLRLQGSCCASVASFVQSSASDETTSNEKCSTDHFASSYASRHARAVEDDADVAYKAFLNAFPEYQLTGILDDLRRSDFSRLDRVGETYVDYMGGALYPESLIRMHTAFLIQNVLGNTHSVSNR